MSRTASLAFAVVAAIAAAPLLRGERPVAMILSGEGAYRQTGPNARWALIETGAELYAGDVMDARVEDVKLAFCPVSSDSAGRLLRVRKGMILRLSADAATANAGAPDETPMPICVFPDLSREYLAGGADFPDLPVRSSPSFSAEQQRALDLADAMASGPELRLIAKATRAALLERYQQPVAALEEYRRIRKEEPRATWTRQRIAVIGASLLPNATTSPNSDGALVPRTRPAQAAEVTDVEPDYSKGEKYALVVGISDYTEAQGVSKLKFAATDAAMFRDYLTKARGGELAAGHIWPLFDKDATRDAMEQALTEFVQGKGGKLNTLIVYVAAHGRYVCLDRSPDFTGKCDGKEEPFIVTRDGDTEAPNISGYPMHRLRELVTRHAAEFGRVLVFVDVCHGGNVTWKGADQRLAPKEVIDTLNASGSHLAIMSASAVVKSGDRSREYAYESPDLKHGVFTYYLLRAMNGDAPPIDNKIVFSTLASTVRLNVQSFTKAVAQTPIASEDSTNEMLPVVDNAEAPRYDLDRVTVATAQLERMSGDPLTGEERRFEEQLKKGQLLGAGGAGEMLRALAVRFQESSPVYQASRNRYRVALEDAGQQIVLRYLQGDQNLLDRSEFKTCAALFQAALELAPDADFDESRMLFCQGRALLYPDPEHPFGSSAKDAEFAGAVKLLERSIRLDPRRSYSYNAIGIGYLESAQYDDATQAFRTAIRFAPYWAYPRHNLALTFTQQGRYDDAIGAYQVAMAAGPNYSYLPYNLGLLYQQLAETGLARTYYRQAEDIALKRCAQRSLASGDPCPERGAPRAGMASLAAGKGKRQEAERLYRAALGDTPGDLTTNHDLAALLSAWKGRETEAETLWKQNLAHAPTHLPSLIGYADLLSKECRFAGAVPLYEQIHQEMPLYVPAQIGLVRGLVATNRLAEAKPLLDQLMGARGSSSAVWALQGEYLKGTGQDANAAWEQALRLAPARGDRKAILQRQEGTACPSK